MARTPSLPIDSYIETIRRELDRSRAVVVTAQPGAGKTTRVPPALVDGGPVILLQPRRVAARAIAGRIAAERGWTLGDEIGWQIRFDRRFGPRTRLLVVTEGILTARLQRDPLLSEFRTIVVDEFHERSIHADVAIALAKQAWRARDDLRIVVMSATLDASLVSAYLDGSPIVDVPGRLHSIQIEHTPGESAAHSAAGLLDISPGHVLCFLPGAAEIRRVIDELGSLSRTRGVEVLPLHGSLDAAAQDAPLRPAVPGVRRIVVATNIAETSLTVPGVSAVVDSGLHKVARYDVERAIDSLETERITQDSADQRAGRAGREMPGQVRRLWDARDRLRPHREPEIRRVDLAAVVLDVLAWGGDPRQLDWIEHPDRDAVDAAFALLERLGAVERGSLTEIGSRIQAMPIHPRLARIIVAASGMRDAVRACALVAERHFLPPRRATTTSDLLSALDDWSSMPPHIRHAASEIERTVVAASSSSEREQPSRDSDERLRRAVLAGYPDRVAVRRERRSPRLKLASGTGAVLAEESGVRDAEFLVAIDVMRQSGRSDRFRHATAHSAEDAVVRMASAVEREWLSPNAVEVVHRFDRDTGTVKAVAVERYDALVLAERPVAPEPDQAAALLADAWRARGPAVEDQRVLARLRFAGIDVDIDQLVRTAAATARTLADVRIERVLPATIVAALARDAPETIRVPSGRSVPLEYADDRVSAAVKLQELFGLAETPRVGPRREPVLLSLLAPNGRPVQLTRDLRSFWERTYPEVRKELRARYPNHPWPEDPWTAVPTHRTGPHRPR